MTNLTISARGIKGGPLDPVIVSGDNPVATKSSPMQPDEFVYAFLQRTSGPASASGDDWNMDTDSDVVSSIFEYEVQPGVLSFKFTRINIEIVDSAIQANRFGGVGALANGCLLQIVDSDSTTILQHFGTDIQPIQQNSNFSVLAGVDAPITFVAGEDLLPIRFSIFKAGAPMELTVGQRVRWVNQDDISGLTIFRIMVQGVNVI